MTHKIFVEKYHTFSPDRSARNNNFENAALNICVSLDHICIRSRFATMITALVYGRMVAQNYE